jgi:predicted small lipoprotein YifL
MVRHPRSLARAATVVAMALAIAGCGIKGPLVPAPKADAAKPPADAGKRDTRPPEPKL